MNCWVMDEALLPVLSSGFAEFLGRQGGSPTEEYRLPDAVFEAAKALDCPIQVLAGGGGWAGLTHPADLELVRAALARRGALPCN